MNERGNSWSLNLIQQIFLPKESMIISTITLTLIDREDQLSWGYTPNDANSVKSAYHLHKTWFNKNKGESTLGLG